MEASRWQHYLTFLFPARRVAPLLCPLKLINYGGFFSCKQALRKQGKMTRKLSDLFSFFNHCIGTKEMCRLHFQSVMQTLVIFCNKLSNQHEVFEDYNYTHNIRMCSKHTATNVVRNIAKVNKLSI